MAPSSPGCSGSSGKWPCLGRTLRTFCLHPTPCSYQVGDGLSERSKGKGRGQRKGAEHERSTVHAWLDVELLVLNPSMPLVVVLIAEASP